MTYLSILRPMPERSAAQPVGVGGLRLSLGIAALAAAIGGIVLGQAGASAADLRAMEDSLVSLLRFMAVLKGAMALAMLGLTWWRFSRPIGTGLALAYAAAVCLAAASPGLIWSLSHVALGAVLFHAGLIVFLLLAWRDDAVELRLQRRPTGEKA